MKDKKRIHLNNIYLIVKEKNRFFDLWTKAQNDYELNHYESQMRYLERKLEILLSELGRM